MEASPLPGSGTRLRTAAQWQSARGRRTPPSGVRHSIPPNSVASASNNRFATALTSQTQPSSRTHSTPSSSSSRIASGSQISSTYPANRFHSQPAFTHPTAATSTSGSHGSLSMPNRPTSATLQSNTNDREFVRLHQQSLEIVKGIEARISTVETKLDNGFSELKKLISDNAKKSFSIQDSGYEPDLRSAMGELFCQSLTRYPTDADISTAIKSVLTREDMKKKYVVSRISTCCNKLLSRFRTEERRKIFGVMPYPHSCYKDTATLCKEIMEFVKAPEEVYSVYLRYLALTRKYVREFPQSKTTQRFHETAKEWMNSNSNLSEEEWKSLMDEDSQHPYSEYPTTYAPPSTDQDNQNTQYFPTNDAHRHEEESEVPPQYCEVVTDTATYSVNE